MERTTRMMLAAAQATTLSDQIPAVYACALSADVEHSLCYPPQNDSAHEIFTPKNTNYYCKSMPVTDSCGTHLGECRRTQCRFGCARVSSPGHQAGERRASSTSTPQVRHHCHCLRLHWILRHTKETGKIYSSPPITQVGTSTHKLPASRVACSSDKLVSSSS